MIYALGEQYLGLNSLFTSILQVLNIAELGVGSAMVFSMYEPISKDDTKKINALMRLYRKYYRIIGGIILTAGLVILPFLHNLIKGETPNDINIYILYLLNLFATVLSYWMFAYRNSILTAYQRVDIANKVSIITDTLKYIFQICAIILFKNYYLYVIVIIITQIINNIMRAIVSYKIYPNYKPIGFLDIDETKKINKRIQDLFTSKIGMVIVNSADNIVISAFLGLRILAIYQNYFFVVSAIIGIVSIIYVSCLAGVGNSLITETKEKNYIVFKRLTFLVCWISGFCTICFLCLYQPFMELWMGPERLLDYSAVVCFALYFFVFEINTLLNMFKDAAGIWHSDRFRPLVTAMSNLIMNLILVNIWGIYGVLLSTVLSTLFVGMPWLMHNLFTTVFSRALIKDYLMQIVKYVLLVACTAIIAVFVCSFTVRTSLLLQLLLNLLICISLNVLFFYLAFCKTEEFAYCVELCSKMVKKWKK